MNVEREIAGFALPFAAGVMAAAIPKALSETLLHLSACISFSVSATILLFLMLSKRQSFVLIAAVALSCGTLTGVTYRITDIGQICIIPEWVTSLSQNLTSHIMSIEFKDSQTNSIITALLTGDRDGLSRETITAFRSSGAAHVLALSGFHLGLIYAMFSRILSFMGNGIYSKILRSILIITTCGIYTAATGAGPSISRAYLFILIGEIASLTRRYRSTSSILMLSLMIHLLISPGASQSIGFQLSYAAMTGIAYLFPWLKGLWPDNERGPLRWIWNSASMSIACQITTGPLVYMYFGTFARHFLLTNLLTLPLASIIIPLSLISICLDMGGICPAFMLTITEKLIEWMRTCLSIISSI